MQTLPSLGAGYRTFGRMVACAACALLLVACGGSEKTITKAKEDCVDRSGDPVSCDDSTAMTRSEYDSEQAKFKVGNEDRERVLQAVYLPKAVTDYCSIATLDLEGVKPEKVADLQARLRPLRAELQKRIVDWSQVHLEDPDNADVNNGGRKASKVFDKYDQLAAMEDRAVRCDPELKQQLDAFRSAGA